MNTDSLILDNLKLINLSIKQMNLSWETEDEYQEYYDAGLDGLINGARTYNSSIGKHSTYLVVCIKNSIKKLLYNKTLIKNFNPYGKDISLYKELYDSEGKTMYLEDIIEDPNINIEQEVEKKIQIEEIIERIESLKNDREKTFMKYKYGIIDGKCYSAREIGEIFGVSHQFVGQKINIAITHIKNSFKNDSFKEKLGGNMGKNLESLNDYLFDELERLNKDEIFKNEDLLLKEISRSKAISDISKNIINNANVVIEANKLFNKNNKVPELLGISKK